MEGRGIEVANRCVLFLQWGAMWDGAPYTTLLLQGLSGNLYFNLILTLHDAKTYKLYGGNGVMC